MCINKALKIFSQKNPKGYAKLMNNYIIAKNRSGEHTVQVFNYKNKIEKEKRNLQSEITTLKNSISSAKTDKDKKAISNKLEKVSKKFFNLNKEMDNRVELADQRADRYMKKVQIPLSNTIEILNFLNKCK